MTSRASEFIRVRPAVSTDSDDFFLWRNDADAIAHSLSGRGVNLREHTVWFRGVLSNPEHILLVGELDRNDGVSKVGMCRFSWQETGGYLVSIAIDAHFRGEGFGHQLLTLAIQSLSDAKPGPVNIVAQVKKDNKASCKLFLGANFESVANDNDVLVFSKIIS